MAALRFRNLAFSEGKGGLDVSFMKYFRFTIPSKDLEQIKPFSAKGHTIDVGNKDKRLYFLLEKGFGRLQGPKKPAFYIHGNSGIPLVGCNEFGIVDRGTNFVEVKPITTCNIDCIYCSVDHDRRILDYVVEEEYLAAELARAIEHKTQRVNIHIGGQGEPLMYSDIVKLVRDMRKLGKIGSISVNTNGILLTRSLADRLVTAGMTHFHISLNAMDEEMAGRIAGGKYPLGKVMDACRHIAQHAKVILVPVWIPSVNDEEMGALIRFSQEIGAKIGIQNFLAHSLGRKPVNPLPMKVFFQRLETLEQEHKADLRGLDGELEIVSDNRLPKPFRKNDTISAEIKCPGRLKDTCIAAAQGRSITVVNCSKKNGAIRVRIIRDKDNIFRAVSI